LSISGGEKGVIIRGKSKLQRINRHLKYSFSFQNGDSIHEDVFREKRLKFFHMDRDFLQAGPSD